MLFNKSLLLSLVVVSFAVTSPINVNSDSNELNVRQPLEEIVIRSYGYDKDHKDWSKGNDYGYEKKEKDEKDWGRKDDDKKDYHGKGGKKGDHKWEEKDKTSGMTRKKIKKITVMVERVEREMTTSGGNQKMIRRIMGLVERTKT